MEFEPIDVITQMIDSLLVQYVDSPNLQSYISVILEPLQELEDVFSDILNLRLIDNAENAQLNVNGKLVVLDRGVYDSSTVNFFGLDDDDTNNPIPHLGLGDLTDPLVGGFFRSLSQPVAGRTYLSDDDYRLSILAKAKKNSFKGGVENILEVINQLITFETGESVEIKEDFTTPSDPFVKITFHKDLNNIQRSFFTFYDILPKGGGIRYEYEDNSGSF